MEDAQEPRNDQQVPPAAPGSGPSDPSEWAPPPPQGGAWGQSWPPPPNYPGWGPPQGAWGAQPPGGWATPWNPSGDPRPRRTLPSAITALLLVVAVLVGLGLGHGVWRTDNPRDARNRTGTARVGRFDPGNVFGQNPFNGGSSSGPSNVSGIAPKAAPGLVDINTALTYQGGQAAGTGIVLTSDGFVLDQQSRHLGRHQYQRHRCRQRPHLSRRRGRLRPRP